MEVFVESKRTIFGERIFYLIKIVVKLPNDQLIKFEKFAMIYTEERTQSHNRYKFG